MADATESAWVEVLPDLREFLRRTNSDITPALSHAGDVGARGMGNSMRGVFSGAFFGTILADLGSRIVGSIVNGIRSGVETGLTYTFDSIQLASELEQSTGAIEAIFKEQASAVKGFAAEAVEAVGLTQAEYQSFAAVVGAQLKNLGVPFDEVSGKTNDLIQLGADLAAQFGKPTQQAVSALSALLRGERDPIEQFGVGLKQVDIDARVAANGLSDLTGEALRQAQIAATLELLWKQTADAQGTFAREEGTFAGQQQRLNAELAQTQTALGQLLLPVATEFLEILRSDFIPILQETTQEIGPILAGAMRDTAPAFRDLLDALAPLIPDLVELAVSAIPPLVDLLVLMIPLIQEWANFWTTASDVIGGFFDLISGDTSFEELGTKLINSESSIFSFFESVIIGVRDFGAAIGTGIGNAIGFVRSIPQQIQGIFTGAGSWLIDSGRALIQGFISGINQMLKPVRDAVNGVMKLAAGFFPHSPAEYGPFSGSGWSAVKSAGQALFNQFESGFGGELGASLAVPMVSVARAPSTPLGGGASGATGFMDPEERRILRDLAARVVELNVDSETVARASISGSARLSALGAS